MEARMIGDYGDGDGGIALPLDDPAFADDQEVRPGDYRDPKFFNIRFPWMDNKMDEASRISRYKLCLFFEICSVTYHSHTIKVTTTALFVSSIVGPKQNAG